MTASPRALAPSGSPTLLRGGGWVFVGTVIGQGCALGGAIASARMLGGAQYGVLGFGATTATAMAAVASFAPALWLTRTVAKGGDDGSRWRHHALRAALHCAVLMALIGAATLIGWFPMLHGASTFAATMTLAMVLTQFQMVVALLMGREQFRRLAKVRVGSSAASAVVLVAGAFAGGSVGAIAGSATGTVAGMLLAVRSAGDDARRDAAVAERRADDRSAFAVGDRVGWWAAVITGVLSSPVLWVAQALLQASPDAAVTLAQISVVGAIGAALQFVPGSIGQALLPRISRGASRPAEMRTALAVAAASTLVPWAVLSLTAHLWVRAYGPAFLGAESLVPWLLGAAALQGVSSPLVRYLEATAQMQLNLGLNIVWASILILGTWLSPTSAGDAYARASVAGFGVHTVALLWFTRRAWWR